MPLVDVVWGSGCCGAYGVMLDRTAWPRYGSACVNGTRHMGRGQAPDRRCHARFPLQYFRSSARENGTPLTRKRPHNPPPVRPNWICRSGSGHPPPTPQPLRPRRAPRRASRKPYPYASGRTALPGLASRTIICKTLIVVRQKGLSFWHSVVYNEYYCRVSFI